MTQFWFATIPLFVLAILAVAWPLFGFRQEHQRVTSASHQRREANIQLYREHLAELKQDLAAERINAAQYEQLQQEAQRNLLEDEKRTVVVVANSQGRNFLILSALLVIALGAVLYIWRGNVADVQVAEQHRALLQADMADFEQHRQAGPERTEEMISLLHKRALERPDNAQYWYLLARYQLALGDVEGATEALRQLRRLYPEDAANTAQLAQVLFLQGNHQVNQEIRNLVRDALFTDPQEPTALGLAGIDAYQTGDYQAAIDYWQRVLPSLSADSQTYHALSGGIERAREQLRQTTPETEAATSWRLPVTINLAETLELPPQATLFVMVRPTTGSPMPLLVTRFAAGQFPLSLVMDETMAMIALEDLSQYQQLQVVARVSLSGNATPSSGDLQGASGGFDAEAPPEQVEITIDQRLP